MMSPRKKRGYYAIISVVGIALMVDRLVLKSGSPDSAAAVQIFVDAPAAERTQVEEDSTLAIPELHFPCNLSPYDPWTMTRDIFAPPTRREGHGDSDATGNFNGKSKSSSFDGRMNRGAFEKSVALNGVIVQEGLEIAITDGQWLRIGQSYHGCALHRVSGNTAVFQCNDGEAVLRVNSGLVPDRD